MGKALIFGCVLVLLNANVNAADIVQKEAVGMEGSKKDAGIVSQQEVVPKMYLADYLSYLTAHIRSQQGQVPVTGTGFYFTFRIKDGSGRSIPALVTNKHVVLGYTNTTLVFTVAKDGLPTDETVEYRLGPENCLWYPHPDPDVDLCVLPILSIINHFKGRGIDLFISPLNYSYVADADFLYNVTQLDDVVMIGYPDGIWDKINNQPIFRKGVFATKPSRSYNGKREFIIDMPVFSGSGGSPVLIASDGPWMDRSHNALRVRSPIKLVGIVYKTFIHNDLGQLVAVPIPAVANGAERAALVRVPNNLGLVISASRMLEFEDMFTELWGQKGK